jgi:hypothetical protein
MAFSGSISGYDDSEEDDPSDDSAENYDPHCCVCRKLIRPYGPEGFVRWKGHNYTYCVSCIGFHKKENRPLNREDYIRMGLPEGVKDMPALILADWISEKQGRELDADYLRQNTRMSGG